MGYEGSILLWDVVYNDITSISHQIMLEVALKFGGEEGIIIQFNTSKTTGFEYLRGFDCSFISRYKEEEGEVY